MELTLMHLYPDLMNLYGSWGNMAVLRKHLEDLGHTVTVTPVAVGEKVALEDADFLYMGAGTERSQKAALSDFTRFSTLVKDLAGDGLPMLFTGNSMQLLGHGITDVKGHYYMGIGLSSFVTTQGARRFTTDVLGRGPLFPHPIVGFMNSSSLISGVKTPLLNQLDLGFGNEIEFGPEGFVQGNVFASELAGPILVKNPPLLRRVILAIYEYREEPVPDEFPRYPAEEACYRAAVQELEKRIKTDTSPT